MRDCKYHCLRRLKKAKHRQFVRICQEHYFEMLTGPSEHVGEYGLPGHEEWIEVKPGVSVCVPVGGFNVEVCRKR